MSKPAGAEGWQEKAVRILRAGGVVMHATETCYGLAADIFNQRALEKLYVLKKMPTDKPVSIMVRGLEEAREYADFSTSPVGRQDLSNPVTSEVGQHRELGGLGGVLAGIGEQRDSGRPRVPEPLELAKKYWPGPLTLVLPRTKLLPAFLNPGSATVGVRCPDSVVSMALLDGFDGPLTTTSANLSGLPEVYKVSDYLAQLAPGGLGPDLILDQGELPKNKPSTVVKFDEKGIKVVREGILWEKIRAEL